MAKVLKFEPFNTKGEQELFYLVSDPAIGCNMPFDKRWTFNDNYEKPTFRPSMRCNYGSKGITHCFVTDGKIEYLSDCTHSMAGKTIDCVDINEDDF